ncbi:hypothetical protein HMI56_003404 [Coelomomyces lativittatus]|nr:hypothetical protein HMI56_003404 [Coelomomyces lativittatus]
MTDQQHYTIVPHDSLKYAQTLSQYLDPQLSMLIWVHLMGYMQVNDMDVKKCLLKTVLSMIKDFPMLEFARAVAKQLEDLDSEKPDISGNI